MKLSAIALDYDGTIGGDNGVDPEIRQAIADVRAHGLTVLLVTGRIMDDLRRVAGDLHFVDVVVAENGAVVEFPATGYTASLGLPPTISSSVPSSSVPAPSQPRIIGNWSGLIPTPRSVQMSCMLRLAAVTFTATQPSGTSGAGRSPTVSESSGASGLGSAA